MNWILRSFFLLCSWYLCTTVSYINREFFKEDLRDGSKIVASLTMTKMFAFGMPDPLANHEVIFALHQRNLDRLDEILESVSTPEQPGYGQYLTRDEVAMLTAPSAESIANVETFLKSFGVHESKQRKTLYGEFIIATAPVIVWEAMFQTVFYELTPKKKGAGLATASSSSKTKTPMETAIRAKHISIPEPLREHVLAVFNTVQLPVFSSSLPPRGVYSDKQAIPRAVVEAMSLGQGLGQGPVLGQEQEPGKVQEQGLGQEQELGGMEAMSLRGINTGAGGAMHIARNVESEQVQGVEPEQGQGVEPEQVQGVEPGQGLGQASGQGLDRLLREQEPVPLTGYTYPKLLEEVGTYILSLRCVLHQ